MTMLEDVNCGATTDECDVPVTAPTPAVAQSVTINLEVADDVFVRAEKIWQLLGQVGSPPAFLAKAMGIYCQLDREVVFREMMAQAKQAAPDSDAKVKP